MIGRIRRMGKAYYLNIPKKWIEENNAQEGIYIKYQITQTIKEEDNV